MVESIDAKGATYRDIEEKLKPIFPERFRRLPLLDGVATAHAIQESQQFPDFDDRTYIVSNVLDREGKQSRFLYQSIYAPGITPDFKEGHMPPEGETFSAWVAPIAEKERGIRILVLAKDKDDAKAKARIEGASIMGLRREALDTYIDELTGEAFIGEVKKKIDRGDLVPDFILRFGDLREYALRSWLKHKSNVARK